MNDTKTNFEAWLRTRGIEPTYTLDDVYSGAFVRSMWEVWRDATGAQDVEIAALSYDVGEYVRIAAEQATEIERLREALELIVSDHDFCGDDWGNRRDAWIETARAAISQGEQG